MIHTLIVISLTSLIWGSALWLRRYLDKRSEQQKIKVINGLQRKRFQQLAGIKRGVRYRVTTPYHNPWGHYDLTNMT